MHVLLLLFQTFNQLPLDGQQTTLPDLYRDISASVQHVRAEYSHFPQKQTYVCLLLYPDSTLSHRIWTRDSILAVRNVLACTRTVRANLRAWV